MGIAAPDPNSSVRQSIERGWNELARPIHSQWRGPMSSSITLKSGGRFGGSPLLQTGHVGLTLFRLPSFRVLLFHYLISPAPDFFELIGSRNLRFLPHRIHLDFHACFRLIPTATKNGSLSPSPLYGERAKRAVASRPQQTCALK